MNVFPIGMHQDQCRVAIALQFSRSSDNLSLDLGGCNVLDKTPSEYFYSKPYTGVHVRTSPCDYNGGFDYLNANSSF